MIEWKKNRGYLVLTMNEPPANALSECFLREFYQTVKKVEKEAVSVVIIDSSIANTFSSGLALGSLVSRSVMKTRFSVYRSVWLVYHLATFIARSDKIYIACMNGAVVGSAVTLALACDMRIGTERTWFWIPDPQYGGLLADGGIDFIKKACNIDAARRLCLTNDRIMSKEALSLGVLNRTESPEQVLGYCERLAKKLSQYSYCTLKETKHIINQWQRPKFHGIRLLRVVCSKEMMIRLKRICSREDI